MRRESPLWECPRCKRTFANRNQTHSCGRYQLESHFRGKSPGVRALFDAEFRAWLAEAYAVGQQRHLR